MVILGARGGPIHIATEIDPKKKRLTTDRVQEIIYRDQTRRRAEDEAKKPPPTKEDEELRDLGMYANGWNKHMMWNLSAALKHFGDRKWKTPEEVIEAYQRMCAHNIKLDICGPRGIKELEDLLAFFRRLNELKPKKPLKKPKRFRFNKFGCITNSTCRERVSFCLTMEIYTVNVTTDQIYRAIHDYTQSKVIGTHDMPTTLMLCDLRQDKQPPKVKEAAEARLLRGRLELLNDIDGAELGVRALVPADVERGKALLGRPHVIGDHRHGVVEAHYLVHALDRLRLAVVHASELAAEHRTGGNGGDLHTGDLHIDAVLGLAVDLVLAVEALDGGADELEVLRVLERDLVRPATTARHGLVIVCCSFTSAQTERSSFSNSSAPGSASIPLRKRRFPV